MPRHRKGVSYSKGVIEKRWFRAYAVSGEVRDFDAIEDAREFLTAFDYGWINTLWYRYDREPEEVIGVINEPNRSDRETCERLDQTSGRAA
jgi:hypothetical protein